MLKKVVLLVGILLVCISCSSATNDAELIVPEDATARIVYFYAEDCALCQTLYDEILDPLISKCGDNLELNAIQVDTPEGYEVFIDAENILIGDAGRWDIS